ncbi:MAG: FAD:protein FMN transferase [Gammaproteobacteria bacterium]|nr:FAD:protein FMN transferase [Gammaproteobacteria bacterium]
MKLKLSAGLLALLFFLIIYALPNSNITAQQRIITFGTVVDFSIATTKENETRAYQAIDKASSLLNQKHHQWHAWQQGDLSLLNTEISQGKTATTNEDIIQLITLSKKYYQQSNQLFNPAIGQLIAAWGFHNPATEPNLALINEIKSNLPNMNQIFINELSVSSSNPYLHLDFGGIAKGLAIQQIKTIFKSYGFNNYLINFGGDLYGRGQKHRKPWVAGIQNPYNNTAIGTLEIAGNIFTSGNYQRFYMRNNKRIHHIINPRTGSPSAAISAVTVSHDNAMTADVAATTFMIAEPNEWNAIGKQLGVSDYLIINENKELWVTASFFEKITFNTQLKIHIIR